MNDATPAEKDLDGFTRELLDELYRPSAAVAFRKPLYVEKVAAKVKKCMIHLLDPLAAAAGITTQI